jgi:hypothetical protein
VILSKGVEDPGEDRERPHEGAELLAEDVEDLPEGEEVAFTPRRRSRNSEPGLPGLRRKQQGPLAALRTVTGGWPHPQAGRDVAKSPPQESGN